MATETGKKYGQEAYDIVCHAANEIGARLPGSDQEKEYADYMGGKLKEIGIEPVKEEFAVSPRSSIGGLPYIGRLGVVLSLLVYPAIKIPSLWIGMALAGLIGTFWLISSVFLYRTWFDMFFRQEISQNVYGQLLPPDGKYDYTIILSGHTDTSWNWRHSEHIYKYKDKPILGVLAAYGKVGFGAVCYFFLIAAITALAVIHFGATVGAPFANAILASASFKIFRLLMLFLPVVTAIGCAFVAMWGDSNPRNASRGAMDNATGCALSYEIIKYFKENPDKMPKNCRIVDLNCGSEEAGLRGSMAFAGEHGNDDLLQNAWHINIDSVADEDYFEVVIKDDWQFTRFDKDLEQMFKDTFKELKIESKSGGCIHNPVGGCDSTPMTRAGVKSVTFAAQNPMLTYYYHTWHDVPERFSAETVGTGFDVLLGVIDKIAAFENNKA